MKLMKNTNPSLHLMPVFFLLVFSQRLLLKLTEAIGSREQAYKIVQNHGLAALEDGKSFREQVLSDKVISKYLKKPEIEECFELDYYLRNVDKIFERVFGK